MVANEVIGDIGDDIVASVGAMPAGIGEPSAGVIGDSEATGETGKVDTGKEPGVGWNVWRTGELSW